MDSAIDENIQIMIDCNDTNVDNGTEKTDTSDESGKENKKKIERRVQRYRATWVDDFPWVVRDPESPLRARCKACKKGLNAHRTILKRHECAAKHKELFKKYIRDSKNEVNENKTAVITVPSHQNHNDDVFVTYSEISDDFPLHTNCKQEAAQVCFTVDPHVSSLLDALNKYLPEPEVTEVKRLIYGRPQSTLQVPKETSTYAGVNNFELRSYKFSAANEELSAPRIVRIGVIQNGIVLATTDPVAEQRQALYFRLEKIVHTAHQCGVNVLCLQEAWTMPFAFCNKEKLPWCELAENAYNGPTIQLCQKWSRQFNMVIISPIIERDEIHGGVLWNTAVVISQSGKIIGLSRKNHISRIGNLNEYAFYSEGQERFPVFETKYGKIAVNIGDGRHIAHSWMMYGLNGAEIVFNPSAAANGLGEQMWGIDARSAAISNGFFTCPVNRVGKEAFFTDSSITLNYFGSSFIAAPDGSRTPELSRIQDGLLVAELDLNLCQQIKDRTGLKNTQRLCVYVEELRKTTKLDFIPHLIKENE